MSTGLCETIGNLNELISVGLYPFLCEAVYRATGALEAVFAQTMSAFLCAAYCALFQLLFMLPFFEVPFCESYKTRDGIHLRDIRISILFA